MPPLKSGGSITVGYGPDGGSAIHFRCSDTISDTIAFCKVIVCTENVKLHHMVQSSLRLPVSVANEPERRREDILDRGIPTRRGLKMAPGGGFWDASLAAVIIKPSSAEPSLGKKIIDVVTRRHF